MPAQGATNHLSIDAWFVGTCVYMFRLDDDDDDGAADAAPWPPRRQASATTASHATVSP